MLFPPRPRFLTAGLLALVGLFMGPLVAPPARAAEPDYTDWGALLQRYTRVLAPKSGPGDTRFDYEQLYVDEKIWTLHRSETLDHIHTQLLSVSPADMTPAERTAWAINAYNFLAIERMTLHLLVPGRKFMRYDSPKQVNTDDGGFFAAPVATVAGQPYSLTGFERRFVYGDTSADPQADGLTPREHAGDPRLLFALCRAALCTGPLQPRPFRADSLERQLDHAARVGLALPTWLRPDRAAGQLAASNRFFEERADFGGVDLPRLVPFIVAHGPLAARLVIREKHLKKPTIFFEPNWKLNQLDRPKQKPPGAADADSVKATKKG